MLILGRADVERLLPMRAAIDVVRQALIEYSAGRAQVPLRTRVVVDGGDGGAGDGGAGDGGADEADRGDPAAEMYVMPGHIGRMGALGVKIWSRIASAGGGDAVTSAVIVYHDLATGTEVIMDAGHVTDVRTGALSAVACSVAARPDARVAALIGAGAQARTQLDALLAATDVAEVGVWARTAEHASSFVERARERFPGRRITVARSPEHAVRAADVIATATTSPSPVFADEWVTDHALVCGVGSHTLDAAEIHPRTVARAELVLVDTREGTLASAGDVRGPLDAGMLREDAIIELGEAVANGTRREFAAPAVFKSVGFAALDVAAAKAVTVAALRIGAGTWVTLH